MSKLAIATLVILLSAGAATAGETGIINQAGPYEATMKFYLHPAHGFPGTAEADSSAAAAAGANVAAGPSRKPLASRSKDQGVERARDTSGPIAMRSRARG